jgi:hypothetical protein
MPAPWVHFLRQMGPRESLLPRTHGMRAHSLLVAEHGFAQPRNVVGVGVEHYVVALHLSGGDAPIAPLPTTEDPRPRAQRRANAAYVRFADGSNASDSLQILLIGDAG